MKLDKSKPHGIISGEHFGAAFEQDGRVFDADGDEIVITQEDIDANSASDEQENETPVVAKKGSAKKPVAPKATRGKRAVKPAEVADPTPVSDPIDAELSAQTGA